MKPVRGGAESRACGELGLPVSQGEASSAGPPASAHNHTPSVCVAATFSHQTTVTTSVLLKDSYTAAFSF